MSLPVKGRTARVLGFACGPRQRSLSPLTAMPITACLIAQRAPCGAMVTPKER